MTTRPSNLSRLFAGLEALYGADSGLDPHALLLPCEVGDDDVRERLFVHEADDGVLELGLAIDGRTLAHAEEAQAALAAIQRGFSLEALTVVGHADDEHPRSSSVAARHRHLPQHGRVRDQHQ